MPRLAWGGAGAHSLGVGGRLVETDARTLHPVGLQRPYVDGFVTHGAYSALNPRKSLCRQAKIMGGLRVDVLRAHPLLDHPFLEPSQHFKCPHQDVGCTARSIASSAGARLHGLFDLLLDGFLVEARALLHRRKIDRGPGEFGHLVLHQHEAPELKPPTNWLQRPTGGDRLSRVAFRPLRQSSRPAAASPAMLKPALYLPGAVRK